VARPPGRVRVGSMLIQHRVRSAGLGLMRWVPFGIAALPAGTTDAWGVEAGGEAQATANAGPSTAQFAKGANCSAQDDKVWVMLTCAG
jgi:hypothetical protein